MKKLKRMLAVLLTAIMTLAMATTAFAAEQSASTGTLSVQVNQKNTLENQTIKIYKLFDLTVSDKHLLIQLMNSIKLQLQKRQM